MYRGEREGSEKGQEKGESLASGAKLQVSHMTTSDLGKSQVNEESRLSQLQQLALQKFYSYVIDCDKPLSFLFGTYIFFSNRNKKRNNSQERTNKGGEGKLRCDSSWNNRPPIARTETSENLSDPA